MSVTISPQEVSRRMVALQHEASSQRGTDGLLCGHRVSAEARLATVLGELRTEFGTDEVKIAPIPENITLAMEEVIHVARDWPEDFKLLCHMGKTRRETLAVIDLIVIVEWWMESLPIHPDLYLLLQETQKAAA